MKNKIFYSELLRDFTAISSKMKYFLKNLKYFF